MPASIATPKDGFANAMGKCIYFLFICMINLIAVFHFWSPAGWSGKSSMWGKLPNSGDTLELMVPSGIRKDTCGWSNDSCMVTSQKAYENNVGYRGSKSDFKEVTSYIPLGFALSCEANRQTTFFY